MISHFLRYLTRLRVRFAPVIAGVIAAVLVIAVGLTGYQTLEVRSDLHAHTVILRRITRLEERQTQENATLKVYAKALRGLTIHELQELNAVCANTPHCKVPSQP